MSQRNICKRIVDSQITGRQIRHKQVSSALLECESGHLKEAKEVWELLRALDDLFHARLFKEEKCIRYLKTLQRLFDGNRVRILAGERIGKNLGSTVVHMIYMYGGVEVLQRIIFHPSVFGRVGRILNSSRQIIRALVFDILNRLCLLLKDVALTIGSYDHLIAHLFSVMEDSETYGPASTLLEELLSVNRKIVDLATINNIPKLVKDMEDSNFPSFCRLLSTTVADIDYSEERVTLILQDREEKTRKKEKSIAEKNQDLLLSIPQFIERMIKLGSQPLRSTSTRLRARFMLPTLEAINRTVMGDIPMDTPDQVWSSTSSRNSLSEPLANEFLIQGTHQFLSELMQHVEILHVITLFLCGNHKCKLQDVLSDAKFLPALSDMFETLGWSADNIRFPRHNHNETEDCDCTPESVLKIQYLRFVHSFSDHNEKRYILLSLKEAEEMRSIFDSCKIPRPAILDKSKSKYLCRGQKGLLTKIIETLKSTTANNALRFWLCRAIEGFLRGTVSQPDQMFLINRGLVKHLFEHIVEERTKSKDILQSSFDLLGEVMKFNAHAFRQFNEAVCNESQLEKFLSVMTSNIVDSNMFIRCIALSYEKFIKHENYDTYACCLCELVIRWEQKMYLMYKLITSISVDSLTQENVSCLNTVLVFLIFAHRHGKLDEYLNAFQMEEHAHKHSGLLLNNLYDLLMFWRVHYFDRTKDCSQLGQSSCIGFENWKSIVEVLLNTNHKEKTSILYYLNSKHNSLRFYSLDRTVRDV